MKTSKLRKSLLLMLVLLLTASMLAACGGNNNTANNNDSNAAGDGDSGSNDVVELDLFVDQPWWPLKDWSGKIPEEITKRTGIKLNVTVATDANQLPVMIASGDLPDLVVTYEQVKRMADPNISYAWQDLIDEYAPDFKIEPERIAVNTADDGKYYTIRNNFSTGQEWKDNETYALSNGAGIAYRADIVEKLGNPKIETLDDLTNLFQMVKDQYPDMIPLAVTVTPTWTKGYFAMQFGAGDRFVEKDGKLVHALRTEELENMYMYMNELYRKGFINAENFAYKNEEQAEQLATSGKAFAYTWTTSGADAFNAVTKDQGMVWKELPMKINDDFAHVRYDTGWQGVFITKENKNPEASIKLMQFLMSEEGQQLAMWGIEGEDWNWSEDGGYPVFTYDRSNQELWNEMGVYYWGLLAGSAVTEALGNYVPGTEATKANQELSQLTTFEPEIGLVQPGADSQEQVILNNIDNMMTNEEVKVYLAPTAEEAKKAYDNMLSQAEKIGLSDLEAWANEEYVEVKAKFE
ncbi:extracellular solute-binding protein [Marinicrinis lubricantis]|uniref:Extracellular solute-binding protein n=1 Tax=Marinicrinis lubricantis TaxID=2086470 RepID=A0ABW1IP27_9BACL